MRVALLAFISALFAACIVAPVQGQNINTIVNDVATMNYALALEALEATYYSCYLYPLNTTNSDCVGRGYNGFSQAQFASEGYNASVYNAVVAIAQQELSHQALLNVSINNYRTISGNILAVSRCTYNLNLLQVVTNVTTFLQLARILENTGVQAYAGAVNTITDPGLEAIAVSIATVEARHAAWLNSLLGVQPYATSGFDPYQTPAQIAAAIGSVFVGTNCVTPSSSQTLPTVRPYGVAGVANSNATDPTGPLSQAAGVSYSAAQRANDLLVLNYALTLELLEASFYNAAGAIFTQANFTNAGLSSTVYNNFVIIGLNENTHVAALRATISAYGGTPVGNCTYNFGSALSSFQNYLNTAQLLENTGVQAYTGAAGMITDTNLQRTAATIAMIEARHAAYINVINTNPTNDTNAFPASRDIASTPNDIISAVVGTGLVSNCPTQSLPTTLPINGGVPSSTGLTSTGRNGASSSSSFSVMMIIAAIIASLALVL